MSLPNLMNLRGNPEVATLYKGGLLAVPVASLRRIGYVGEGYIKFQLHQTKEGPLVALSLDDSANGTYALSVRANDKRRLYVKATAVWKRLGIQIGEPMHYSLVPFGKLLILRRIA